MVQQQEICQCNSLHINRVKEGHLMFLMKLLKKAIYD